MHNSQDTDNMVVMDRGNGVGGEGWEEVSKGVGGDGDICNSVKNENKETKPKHQKPNNQIKK